MPRRRPLLSVALVAALALTAGACGDEDGEAGSAESGSGGARPDPEVVATVETDPVRSAGDAADDAAIWFNEADPAASTVIGTDKQAGLSVYDLEGNEVQHLPDGQINNVDLRHGFRLGGEEVALVTGGNESGNTIAVYRVEPSTGELVAVGTGTEVGIATYGSCMYRSDETGRVYYIVNSKQGEIEQWELTATPAGEVDARRVRTLALGSQTEGCVADDELGRLYVGEEEGGVWRFDAEPDGDSSPTQVDSTGPGGNLTADVEGLTLATGPGSSGYLVASSQGSDSYVLYEREGDNAFVDEFSIGAGDGVDGVEDTDGVDVTTADLGPPFPEGLLVVQDGANGDEKQNFKLVPWGLVVDRRPVD